MRIRYISVPHPSLLLRCHLNCPSLDCVDSCPSGSLSRRWLLEQPEFRNCYFSGLPHLPLDLAVSVSSIRVADLACLFDGFFAAY